MLAILALAIEFNDMPGDREALSGSFLFVLIIHGADINTFSLATFGADQVMMVMAWFSQFIDIAGTAINLMDDIQFGQQGKIAVNGVQ